MANSVHKTRFEGDSSSLQSAAKKGAKAVEGLNKVNQKAGATTQKFGKKTANAVPAMQEFSRVIQDAPYGIQGVANNIQQLTAQFGYLQKQTGGTKNALKSMAGALAGPTGILLAVSVVTALLPTFLDELEKTKVGAYDVKDAFKDASEDIGEQIGKLNQLTSAYKSNNTTQREKKKILSELNDKFPEYFSNLDAEKTSYKDLLPLIEAQKRAIIGLGIVKSLEAKKAPLYAKLAETELQGEVSGWQKAGEYLAGAMFGGFSNVAGNSGKQAILDTIEDLSQTAKDAMAEYGISEFDASGASGGGKDDAEERVAALTGLPTADQMYRFGTDSKHAFQNIIKLYGALSTEVQPLPPLVDPYKLTSEQILYYDHLEKMKQITEDFNQDFEDLLENTLYASLSNLGSSIGRAFAQGENVFAAIGQSLLQSAGSFLSQLGGMLIQYGILTKTKGELDVAMATGGPAAIVAGTAAIGVGVAALAAGAAMSAFASRGFSGGRGSAGGYSSSNLRSAGSTTPSFQGSSVATSGSVNTGGRYVFEIEGTKLVGVLSNTLARNRALGTDLNF